MAMRFIPASTLEQKVLVFARSGALGKAWVKGHQPVFHLPFDTNVGDFEKVIGAMKQGEFPDAHLVFENNRPGIAFFEDDPPRPAA